MNTEFIHDLSDKFVTAATILVQCDLDRIFDIIEPLLLDTDKYKQRAGAEVWAGLIRGMLCRWVSKFG